MGAHGGRFRSLAGRNRRRADAGRARMTRILVAAAAAAAILVIPATAQAASPRPTPSLDGVLAVPVDTGFVEVAPGQGLVEGPITAHQIAGSGTNPNQDEAALTRFGFVQGYGRTWFDQAKKHELQEVVIAFSGGAGAIRWLGASESTDKANQYYVRGVTVGGIASYYGVHLADPPQSAYVDLIGFVKGNDYFLIAAASTSDDLDTSTATQAKGQYDFAPSNTIPPSEWPEHPGSLIARIGGFASGLAGVDAVVIALLIALAVLAVVLIRRRRTGALPAATAVATGAVQMSPDGAYWWDGQAWKDAASEVPPGTLRSDDGYYWWDGRVWRLLPETPSAAS